MNAQIIFNLIKKSVTTLALSGCFIAALSFLILVTTQKNFKASSDVLVVQNQSGFTDYYALSRSADFLTGILVESIYSEKFLDEMNSDGVSATDFLPNDKLNKLKEWKKIVKITRNPILGTIRVEVFGNTQKQVMDVSNAVLAVLISKSYLFLGSGQNLDVRVLNSPILEKNPNLGDIVSAVSGGFIVGVVLMFIWIFYKNEKSLVLKQDDYIESLEQLQ